MFERLRSSQQSGESTDADLHLAALHGSGDAMASLYRRHGGLVYRFTLRMAQDTAIAEEVTQEVFLALLNQLDRFDATRAALPTWLCAIARRQLWKHLDRNDHLFWVDTDDPPESESLDDSPITLLLRQEAITTLWRGLAELPLPLREVLVLCELEEMSYEQTAAVLAVPIGTVRSRLHRAKARLASLLRAPALCAETEKKCG
jgi:RNA polymerase sigma-70 factor (ECF subfamily)